MTTEKHDPWALLREARDQLVGVQGMGKATQTIARIDAALAEGCPDCGHPYGQQDYCQGDGHAERQDSAKEVVESDAPTALPEAEWWAPPQQQAEIGGVYLRVWCASPHEWHWTVWRAPQVESGKCTTEAEAEAVAIAAARGVKRLRSAN